MIFYTPYITTQGKNINFCIIKCQEVKMEIQELVYGQTRPPNFTGPSRPDWTPPDMYLK